MILGIHYCSPSMVYSPQAPGCDEQLFGPQGHPPLPLRRAVLALLIRWGGAAAQRCHGSGCHGSGSGKVELFNPSIPSFGHIPISNFSWYSTRTVAITEVLKSTFSVLEGILAHKSDKKLSPLEESFIQQPKGGRQSLFHYLSSFLYPHHDPDLTTRAIRLFGKLCQVSH